MASKKSADVAAAEKTGEAKNLAREAVEAIQHGDREEGKFLAEEAKALDPAGAADVLKDQTPGKARKGG